MDSWLIWSQQLILLKLGELICTTTESGGLASIEEGLDEEGFSSCECYLAVVLAC